MSLVSAFSTRKKNGRREEGEVEEMGGYAYKEARREKKQTTTTNSQGGTGRD